MKRSEFQGNPIISIDETVTLYHGSKAGIRGYCSNKP